MRRAVPDSFPPSTMDPSSPALIVKADSSRLASSPEMRYLLSLTQLQAQRAFGDARLELRRPEDCHGLAAGPGDGEGDQDGPVLLLGAEDVFVGEASLRAMARQLSRGAEVVVPAPISAFHEVAGRELFSLRDFESCEARCLAAEISWPETDAAPLPVSLWQPQAWRRFGGDDLGEAGHARGGVYHAFVDYYGELRDDIGPWVPEGVSDVLEVGCGLGRTGAWLERTFACRVTGIELHPTAAAEAARRLHRVHQGDVLQIEPGGPFDLVVALELFEHLPEPEPFLQRMREVVRPGGRIVLSVPNVGHYSVVEGLLAGRWDYVPIGLLCYTHYRFFTRRTLDDWLQRLGFPRYRLEPQTTTLPPSAAHLTELPQADAESLATKGFYVVIDL